MIVAKWILNEDTTAISIYILGEKASKKAIFNFILKKF